MAESTQHNSICSLGLCRSRGGRLRPRAAAHSDIGQRKSNEDLVFADSDCRLYVALDGVGGHAGGAEASRILLEKLRCHIEQMCGSSEHGDANLRSAVKAALTAATKEMLQVASVSPRYEKMATVFALAYIVDDTLLFTNVGDCRVYLVRGGKAKQLTSDQTYVQLMVDVGVIDPDDVPTHPLRNVVLNSVGAGHKSEEPSIASVSLIPGDVVLLTTDGATDKLEDSDLAQLARHHEDPSQVAERIVDTALVAGARDNVSCVVVKIDRDCEASMTKHDELHFELAKLHEMLADVDSVDETLRDDMTQIVDDIKNTLAAQDSNNLGSLSQRMRDRALEFEVTHPRLTRVVSSIADLLAGIGI